MKKNNLSPSESTAHKRYFEIDFWRGLAICMMIVFHFCFDLNFMGFAKIPIFSNPFWLVYREFGVFIFLGISGFCLVLEHQNGIRWKLFWKRFLKLFIAGGLITLGSYYYDPSKTIWLGILQFYALASLLGLYFLRWEKFNLLLGVLIVALGFIGNANEAKNFMGIYWTWVGFGTMHLSTLEIFPLVPFFGYFLVGIYLGKKLLPTHPDYFFHEIAPESPLNRFFAFFGRYSLLTYLLHQPILIGLLYAWKYLNP